MKKVKRILAIIGVVLLAGLYLSTLIFAIIDSDDTMTLLKASIYSTIVVPVLIWAYGLVYRLLKNHYSLREDSGRENSLRENSRREDIRETGESGAGEDAEE